jgi:hypothetical protein
VSDILSSEGAYVYDGDYLIVGQFEKTLRPGLKPPLFPGFFGTTEEAGEKVVFADEKGAGTKARYSFCSACGASKLAP